MMNHGSWKKPGSLRDRVQMTQVIMMTTGGLLLFAPVLLDGDGSAQTCTSPAPTLRAECTQFYRPLRVHGLFFCGCY